MKEKYKLKYTLYFDADGECVLPYKLDETYSILAKKGQIAERFELNDELREEYGIYDTMWKYIWIFQTGVNYLLTQNDTSDNFEKVGG